MRFITYLETSNREESNSNEEPEQNLQGGQRSAEIPSENDSTEFSEVTSEDIENDSSSGSTSLNPQTEVDLFNQEFRCPFPCCDSLFDGGEATDAREVHDRFIIIHAHLHNHILEIMNTQRQQSKSLINFLKMIIKHEKNINWIEFGEGVYDDYRGPIRCQSCNNRFFPGLLAYFQHVVIVHLS